MKKHILINIIILFTVEISIFTSLCMANENVPIVEPEFTESQLEVIKKELDLVTKEYILLMRGGKIPSIIASETGGNFFVVKLTPKVISISLEFHGEEFKEELHACSDIFMVNVERKKPAKTIRVFLCKKKEKIELMSVYSFEDGKWIKKK